MQELAEALVALHAAEGVEAGDGLVNEGVAVGLVLAEDAGEHLDLGHAVEQREDHGLHGHDGAVGGAGVAPRLEVVGGVDKHTGGRGRGGLIYVVAKAHDLAGLGHGGGEREVGGGVVGGVAAEEDEGLDRAGLERGGDLGDAGGGGSGHGDEVHRVADGVEGLVQRVNDGVHLGGQVRAGDDEALPLVLEEVGGAGGQPLVGVLELEALGELGKLDGAGDAAGQRGDEAEQVAAGEAEAMIRHRAGEGEGALDRVEAVEVGVLVEGFAALGEVAGVGERAGLGGEEIGVERNDALGLGEAVEGLHVAAKDGLGGGGGRLVGDGLILGPDCLGQGGLELGDEAGAGGRAGGLGEENEPGALGGLGLGADGGEHILDLRGAGGGALDGRGGGAVRIVEIEDGSLHEGVGRAAVGGVGRVALELGGATGVRLGQDRDRVAPHRHGRGVVKREAGDDVLDRLAVGEDVGLGAAATGGQAHATEGERGGHELEELAAIDAVQVVRTLGEFALDLGLHGGRGGEIVEAAPVAGAGREGLGGVGRGMVKCAFHRRCGRSAVAARAALGGLDIPVVDKLLALFELALGTLGVLPVEVGDERGVAKDLFRLAMTLQTPAHGERLGVADDFHLVDLAVALDAGDAAGDVHGVVEINVVGGLMDAHPRHGVAGGVALAHRGEQGAVGLDLVVTVHARLGGRHVGVAGLLDVAVTVAAIQTQLAGVQRVAERDGLIGGVAHAGVFRRGVVVDAGGNDADGETQKEKDLQRQLVGRLGEQVGHRPEDVAAPVAKAARRRLKGIARAGDRPGVGLDGERHLGGGRSGRSGGGAARGFRAGARAGEQAEAREAGKGLGEESLSRM